MVMMSVSELDELNKMLLDDPDSSCCWGMLGSLRLLVQPS